MSDAAVAIRDLKKEVRVGFWGTKKALLHGVTFDVRSGTTLGFVGPNGAGKSTTIKHLIGGARPTGGEVRVLGGDPTSPKTRKRFGYMPELPYLPPTLTPAEMIRLHAALCGVDARADALLTLVGLERHAHERTGTFSKGMQTRLTLALALLHEPELLILDEPMSGLDPVGRQLVRSILRDQAAAGRTILFSSHVLADVEALCDDVAVIKDGRLVYAGPAVAAVGEHAGAWTVRVRTADGKAPTGVRDARKEGDTFVVVAEGKDALACAQQLQSAGATVLSVEPLAATLEERMLALLGTSTS